MSKDKSTWGESFDQVVTGASGARRFPAGRDAKYKSPYGPGRPGEQQPRDEEEQREAKPQGATPTHRDASTQQDDVSLEHLEDLEQLLQDVAQEFGLPQQGQVGQLPRVDRDDGRGNAGQGVQGNADNQEVEIQGEQGQGDADGDQESDESESDDSSSTDSDSGSDTTGTSSDDKMAGTKIGIPKYTGQESDVSDVAKDWLTGLETYFEENTIPEDCWVRRLIRWSLKSDSIPEGQSSTSASSWFKGIMEDDGGRTFTDFTDFRTKFEKRWITGTPLEEASNIFRRLSQNQKETIREYSERIMREDGKLSRLGLEVMACPAANRAGWRLTFEWLNIIVLMGGLCNEYLNHVKRAVAQLPAGYAWGEVRETASVQQDHEDN